MAVQVNMVSRKVWW